MQENLVISLSLPFVFVCGAAIGSFLNVVVYRVPGGLSVVYPPSHCPHCLGRLGIGENIPILGWIICRGRCRYCGSEIDIRYLLVEVLSAAIFCLVFLKFGYSIVTPFYWVLLSWLIVLALIDLDTYTLPNSILKSGLIAGISFQAILGLESGQLGHTIFISLASAWLGLILLDIIRIISSFALQVEAMGDGDPKLTAMIGVWLGWKYLLLSIFLACLIGAITGIFSGKLNQRQIIPFGPFLAIGALLTVFWGNEIIFRYVKLFFPYS